MTNLILGATSIADAMHQKAGPDLPPDESPPGKSLAEMDRETLALVLVAMEGTCRQLQHAAFTTPMRRDAHTEFVRNIGRLQTAAHQLRRYLTASAAGS